jgi:hypothetical protein
MTRIDARIPVFLASAADTAAKDVAWLMENPNEAPWDSRDNGHVAGCACCVTRSPVADMLGRLFRARAVGEVPFFTRLGAVPAGPAGEAALRQALDTDGLVSAYFRLDKAE